MAPIKYAASAARAAGITGTPNEGFRLPRSCVRFANTGLVLGRAGQFSHKQYLQEFRAFSAKLERTAVSNESGELNLSAQVKRRG